MPSVLSIDLGLHMGYAIVTDGILTRSGMHTLGKRVDGHALVRMHDFILCLLADYSPQLIAYEQVFQHHKSKQTAKVFGMYECIILLLGEQLLIRCIGYKVHDIKRYWTDKATADKSDMVKECYNRFKFYPDENEADAIAVGFLAFACELERAR